MDSRDVLPAAGVRRTRVLRAREERRRRTGVSDARRGSRKRNMASRRAGDARSLRERRARLFDRAAAAHTVSQAYPRGDVRRHRASAERRGERAPHRAWKRLVQPAAAKDVVCVQPARAHGDGHAMREGDAGDRIRGRSSREGGDRRVLARGEGPARAQQHLSRRG